MTWTVICDFLLFLWKISFIYVHCIHILDYLANVLMIEVIIAAIDVAELPMLKISAILRGCSRKVLLGTTISQPGSTFG